MNAAIVSGASSCDDLLHEPRVRRAQRVGASGDQRGVEIRRVQVDEPARQRLVRRPPAWPAAGRDRVPGGAVVPAVVREHLVLRGRAGLFVVLAGHLDRRLRRFRSAREELHGRVLRRGDLQQLRGELEGPVAGPQRGARQREALHLAGRGLDDRAIAVPEVHAERPGQAVDVPLAVDVRDVDAPALGEDQRVLREGLHRHEIDHDVAREFFHRRCPPRSCARPRLAAEPAYPVLIQTALTLRYSSRCWRPDSRP